MTISEQLPSPPTTNRSLPSKLVLKSKHLLTRSTSERQTYHLVLDLCDSQISFKPGDSLAIHPQNDPLLVKRLLNALHFTGDEIVIGRRNQSPTTTKNFLTHQANLSRLTSSLISYFYRSNPPNNLKEPLTSWLKEENKPFLLDYVNSHDLFDFLEDYPTIPLCPQELCSQFSPLLPRFYSIASSQSHHREELHLTVALLNFDHRGEKRYGVGSHFLCHLAEPRKTAIFAYVQPSTHFSLPQDNDIPIIMVGPGTGVAPFRAFMQERVTWGAQGKHWLFFGERNEASDFFYKEEWLHLVQSQKLRLDLAFSRDQKDKIYVQHRLYEQRKDLWQWLQEGALFYVCGDAKRMAQDVEAMLRTIAQEEGKLTLDEAKHYVKGLKKQKRYLTDVY